MGYVKSRLKPVRNKSCHGAWVGALILIAAFTVVVALHRKARVDNRRQGCDFEVERVNAQEDVVPSRGCSSQVAYNKFLLGDYSDLQDAIFRKNHGVDITDVKKFYNPRRHNQVYRYRTNDRVVDSDKVFVHAYYSDECSNQLVTQCFSNWWSPKTKKGFLDIMEDLTEKIDWLASHTHEDNKIISSTPNIHYRGCNKEDAKDDLSAAVMDVMGNGSDMVMVQWKTPKCYIEWRLVRASLDGKVIYTTMITYSDQLIRNEDNWQESALDF